MKNIEDIRLRKWKPSELLVVVLQLTVEKCLLASTMENVAYQIATLMFSKMFL